MGACLIMSQALRQSQRDPDLEIHKQYANVNSDIWGGLLHALAMRILLGSG